MISRSTFGHDTTADEVLQGIDLTGQLVLVTGGASGIGVETVRSMVNRGAEAVIAARNPEQGESVALDLRGSTGSSGIYVEQLDLGSLPSVRRFSERFVKTYPKLNLLINSAGIMACPYAETEDGFEMQFGVNHLGHFLMTCLIMPSLLAGAPGRIINLSSHGHHFSPMNFDDLLFKQREYDRGVAYGQSKTANVLFSVELDRRLKDKGIRSFGVHPGSIDTPLRRHLSESDIEYVNKRNADIGMRDKTVEAGASSSVWAATAPELDGKGALYIEDCGIAEKIPNDAARVNGAKQWALDADAAKQLWTVSEEMVGQKFDF